MAAAYAWHPGSGCVAPRWAVPVPLLPDELFSAWLARAALAQGCDPLVLTGEIWPRWRVWALDPDRGLDADKMRTLVEASGVAPEFFEDATLRQVAEAVAGSHVRDRSVWLWMLALGSRNRRRHGGLQYCPVCLAEDGAPYFRLQWRFAWHTVCMNHGCDLLDACPRCGAPVEPHRLTAQDGHLAICATCKAGLGETRGGDAVFGALAFQMAADETVGRMKGSYGDEHLGSTEWFALVRHFVGLLRKVALGRSESLAALVSALGVDAGGLKAPATGLALEMLPTAERATLLSAAWQILAAGPTEFLRAAKGASVTDRTLRGTGRDLPACLERIAGELPEKTMAQKRKPRDAVSKPRSRMAVMRMWARLQRKMPVTER